ncbi:YHYH protein [Tateyamaria omphalii]|uniref:YHYH protein n=1 Tax=Tateyamaria omphalii TaxID=299262 RepID=UPI001C99DEA1|nr:YHYH protein [Tateyamaria omphalii]MBY5933953.1 YHYH protein [Tateyamaria omphalii]
MMFSKVWRPQLALLCCFVVGVATTAGAHEKLHQIETFLSGAQIVSGPSEVDCTLAGGTTATCFSVTVIPEPQSYTPGPWCPRSINDTAAQGGIWLENGVVHDVDGAFVTKLAELYGDTNWQLFDPETGDVRFTGTLEACEAAARPNVDPAYQNHCVECLPEYMPDDATLTFVIPLTPTEPTDQAPTDISGSGIALNGVRLDAPAPVEAILGAYTIAPFDDCGGHVNPHVGYHYHAVTDCLSEIATPTDADHGAQIGIAMDGYPIFERLLPDGSEPVGLDACRGHTDASAAYHYHANDAGSNAILPCLSAEAGCVLTDPDGVCDASAPPRRRP